jgi:hypothetical protein
MYRLDWWKNKLLLLLLLLFTLYSGQPSLKFTPCSTWFIPHIPLLFSPASTSHLPSTPCPTAFTPCSAQYSHCVQHSVSYTKLHSVFSPASPCGSVGNSVLEEVNTQYLKELQAKKDNYLKNHFK